MKHFGIMLLVWSSISGIGFASAQTPDSEFQWTDHEIGVQYELVDSANDCSNRFQPWVETHKCEDKLGAGWDFISRVLLARFRTASTQNPAVKAAFSRLANATVPGTVGNILKNRFCGVMDNPRACMCVQTNGDPSDQIEVYCARFVPAP